MTRTKLLLFLLVAGIATLALTGCTGDNNDDSGKAQLEEMAKTEANQQRLQTSQPAPQLNNSLERSQLSERLNRFNVPDKISYIYLFSQMGQPITHFAIKGKVSSVNSMLTTTDQVLHFGRRTSDSGTRRTVVVASPDLDGSYGSNGDGIFFFRASDNAYLEWNGLYFLSDVPLVMAAKPILTEAESEENK